MTAIASPAFASILEGAAAGPAAGLPPERAEEDDGEGRGGAKKKGPARRLSKQHRATLSRLRKL
jgi:hypothetical protein